MLGKLLKQEFRATGRIMLPMLGALIVLSLLACLSGIGLINDVTNVPVLRFLMVLIEIFFGIGIVAVTVVTVIIMISRFYRNLLQDEGYLMFTLPVSVHELIWSKLIVALVWFLVAGLVIFLVMGFLVMTLSNTNLQVIFSELPDWGEIRSALNEYGLRGPMQKVLLAGAACIMLSMIVSCLHFYAAMAMGHMFNEHKVLLSIVFFVAISIAFSIMSSAVNLAGFSAVENNAVFYAETGAAMLNAVSGVLWRLSLVQLIQGAVMYLATVLCLKRGLNLA